MFPHFKKHVSECLQNKMLAVAEALQESMKWNGLVNMAEYYDVADISTIEGNYRSGWIPKQDGGYSVDALIQCNADSSYHLTQKQTEFMNEQGDNCWKQFLSDNDLDGIVSCYDDLTESQREDLADYENDWFDPALLQAQLFVDSFKGDSVVCLRLSVNYKDAPYYREKYAEDIKTATLEIDEFMSMSVESIINLLKV